MTLFIRRVGLLFSSFRPGGVERVMLSLAGGLAQRGILVDLVVVNATGEFKPPEDPLVNVVDLKSRRTIYAFSKLADYLRNDPPDVLFSAQTHLNFLAIITRAFINNHIPLYVSERSSLLSRMRFGKSLSEKMQPLLTWFFYRMATGVVSVSSGILDELVSLGVPKSKTRVVYNSVVNDRILSLSGEIPKHSWYRYPSLPVILSVGRLELQKDHITLINAFSIVQKLIPARLIILGEGKERLNLEKMIKQLGLEDVISLPGYTENPYAFMSHSQLFVLSSKWEGLPGVLIEALACGIPVVSTDCPTGPFEILEGGKIGRLVPIGDPQELAKAIVDEMKSPHDKNILIRRANDFSIESILPQYLDLFFPDKNQSI